jgi:hypothetical protein
MNMHKLRSKKVNTSKGVLVVKEFTYKKLLDYEDISPGEPSKVHLSFLFPKIQEYYLEQLTEDDLKRILEAVKQVNSPVELPQIHTKTDKTIQLSFDETVEGLACRYGVTPLTLISQYSERQIRLLNQVSFIRDMKSFGEQVSVSSNSSSSGHKKNLKKLVGNKRLPPHLREV